MTITNRSILNLLSLVLVTTPVALNGQSVDWKNGVTGNWFTPGNWWGEAIPQAYNNVGIENGGDALINNSGSAAVGETVNVGIGSQGTLRIEAGGVLQNNMSYIGNEIGGNGRVHVTGVGSAWNASGTSPTDGGILTVGLRGNGLLEVFAGATVQAKYGKIGADVSGTGTADIGGLGSTFQLSKDLIVGESGHGSLNIHTAALARAENVFMGFNVGGSGTTTVAGAESALRATRSIYVGYGGGGKLEVSGGAKAGTAVDAEPGDSTLSVGHLAGSVGEVVVSGTGSAIEMRSSVLVGYEGSGTMSVADQGQVS
jgi:fibronectin-binding autotransporter adhesin